MLSTVRAGNVMFRLINLKGFVAFHEKFLSGVPVATSQRPEYGSPPKYNVVKVDGATTKRRIYLPGGINK